MLVLLFSIFYQQARLGKTFQAALKRRAAGGLGCLGDKRNLLTPLAYLPLDLCCVARSQQRLNSELGSLPTALQCCLQQCCSIDKEDIYHRPRSSLSATVLVSIWVSWPRNSPVIDPQLQHRLPPSVLKMSQQSSHKCGHVLQVVCPACYFLLALLISVASGIQRGKTHHGSG